MLLLLTLFVPRTGGLRITPVERIAFEHIFSLVEWEVVNFPQKWLYSLTKLVPGSKPPREERLALVDEYLQTVRAANKEERRIEGANQLRSFKASGSGAKAGPVSDELFQELLARERELRAQVEETVEAEIHAVVSQSWT